MSSITIGIDNIFNHCWVLSTVPQAWKLASVKPITKAAANSDLASSSNFKRIELTSCVGKLFTRVLRNHWVRYMITNIYFNTSIQKTFMPTMPGCTEHHLKLASILRDARKKHKSLAVCRLDLANAYGSVHHSLIRFALEHYQAPPQLVNIIQAYIQTS